MTRLRASDYIPGSGNTTHYNAPFECDWIKHLRFDSVPMFAHLTSHYPIPNSARGAYVCATYATLSDGKRISKKAYFTGGYRFRKARQFLTQLGYIPFEQ